MILIRTGATEKNIRQMFCSLCELDYNEPVNFGWFKLMAYGNSVSVECFDGFKFTINEFEKGVRVSIPNGDLWAIQYETARSLKSIDWFYKFKLIYETLWVNNVFSIRQRENLLKMKQGVMN